MAWKKDTKIYQPSRGDAREPPAAPRRDVPRSKGAVPPADKAAGRFSGEPRGAGGSSAPPPGYTRSEEAVITDGQLGVENLDGGPERANPEGSVDISNDDYHRTEGNSRSRR